MSNSAHVVRVWDLPVRLFPLADCGACRRGLCDLAAQLDGLAWLDWRSHAGPGAVSAALGFPWERHGAIFPVSHLTADRPQAPEILLFGSPTGRWATTPRGAGWSCCCSRCFSPEALTGIYVANDIADVGPLTGMVPAAAADAIDASHAIIWNVLLAAIAPPCAGNRRLCRGQGTGPGAAADHRDEDAAGTRGRAAHGERRARDRHLRRERRGCNFHRVGLCSSRQLLGGTTCPRISPAGWAWV